ncbi:MAG: hypothetical protein JWP25_4905 [Bradyrhizobium sp.]|jgi:hypothetical protein|nr:hypothetical protein [Bradyrhizobium sp.]
MRQTISGLVAAIAVVAASAAPAMACGGLFGDSCSPCSPCAQSYVPAPVYSGCNSGCGGWAYERLPDPVQQYYYVNQGPTYTGPGNFAPYPTYQESAVSGWGAYRHHPYHYGYDGGRYANATTHYYDGAPNVEGPAVYSYRAHSHYHSYLRPWHAHTGYRYGYGSHHGYAPHHSMRYGYGYGAPHHYGHYGYREHTLRRYY